MRNRILRALLQVAFALGALGVFFWRVDTGAVLAQIGAIDLRWALVALIAFTASKVLHAWRWWHFLGRPDAPLAPLSAVFLISNMANSLLPLRAGDLLRVEVPAKRFGIPRSLLASSVFVVESVLDLFAFAVLLVVALLLADLPVVLRPLVGLVGGAAVVLFGAMVVLVRSRDAIEGWFGRVLHHLPDRIARPIERRIPDFVDGMSSLGTNGEAIRVVAISLVAWLVEVGVYFLLARAFGLDLHISQALILMIAANLIVSLPLTPWSIGPYELAVTEALVAIGEPRTEAGAFALGSHLMLQAWIVVTGVAAMLWIRLGPRDLWPGRGASADAGEGSGEEATGEAAPGEEATGEGATAAGTPPPP
ncbi:MAG: lysylphosphatidylglycerol synthase transmembrane domain-containing protein [Dehalococcoidia bacterium]